MPARKTRSTKAKAGETHIIVGGAPEVEEVEGKTAPVSAEEEEMEEVLSMLPEGTIAKLYRIAENGQREYVMETAPGAMTEARIAKNGPGLYWIKMWGPLGDGSGKKGYRWSRQVRIGVGQAVETPVAVAANGAPHESRTTIMDTAVVTFLGMMQRQQQEHSAAMMTLLTNINRPPVAPTADPLLLALLPHMFPTNRPDPIEQATRIAEINAKGASKGTAAEILSMIELIEKIRGGSSGSDGDPGWMRLLEKVAPHILQNANAQDRANAETSPERLPPYVDIETGQVDPTRGALPVSAPNETAATEAIDPVLKQNLMLIAGVIPDLVAGARKGRDPELMADWIASDIPSGFHHTVGPILAAPDFVEQLCGAYPELRGYRPWVEQVRTSLVAALSDEETNDEDDDEEEADSPKPG